MLWDPGLAMTWAKYELLTWKGQSYLFYSLSLEGKVCLPFLSPIYHTLALLTSLENQ